MIHASDVDHDPLSFTLATLPATGTASLSASGVFSYIPANDFIGSISFNVMANDGLLNSTPATITVCIISPDPEVARPSCAPALPVAAPVINVGPGGGGGNAGGGSSSVQSYTSPSYNSAVAIGANSDLTNQLYLVHHELSN